MDFLTNFVNFEKVEQFLRETIFGMIILGAIASILAIFIFNFVKFLFRKLKERYSSFFLWMNWKYEKETILGQKMFVLADSVSEAQDNMKATGLNAKFEYTFLFIRQCCSLILFSTLLIVSILMIFLSIMFFTEKSSLFLVFSISCFFSSLHYTIKASSYLSGLIGPNITALQHVAYDEKELSSEKQKYFEKSSNHDESR